MSKKKSNATKLANAQRTAEHVAAIRREEQRKVRRRRVLVGAAVIGVLAMIVTIATVVQSGRDNAGQAATPPSGVVDTYGVPRGSKVDPQGDTPVTVEVYEDFMCPFCGDFEAAARDTFEGYTDSADVSVQYNIVAFLDSASAGSDYSTRAMNAVGVVLDEAGPDAAVALHDALFANQPAEGTAGPSDDDLVDLAVEAGADRAAVVGPIEDRAFEQWVRNAGDQASKDDVTSTPTVLVDGETIEFETTEDLVANMKGAVDSALAQ